MTNVIDSKASLDLRVCLLAFNSGIAFPARSSAQTGSRDHAHITGAFARITGSKPAIGCWFCTLPFAQNKPGMRRWKERIVNHRDKAIIVGFTGHDEEN